MMPRKSGKLSVRRPRQGAGHSSTPSKATGTDATPVDCSAWNRKIPAACRDPLCHLKVLPDRNGTSHICPWLMPVNAGERPYRICAVAQRGWGERVAGSRCVSFRRDTQVGRGASPPCRVLPIVSFRVASPLSGRMSCVLAARSPSQQTCAATREMTSVFAAVESLLKPAYSSSSGLMTMTDDKVQYEKVKL